MAGPKAQTPAPIDRPLSRAYLREFTGWSTAYPPGISDPTSLRLMENVMVNRDGSVRVRPGLRYLSYATVPDEVAGTPGVSNFPTVSCVGSHEAFYLNDGSKAYLYAVRETDGTVAFRVLADVGHGQVELSLTEAGFVLSQTEPLLRFSAATTYVRYLQIDNRIFALSNAGEPMRLFFVGEDKRAKVLTSLERPEWNVSDKLTVVHPDAGWINSGIPIDTRTNHFLNPTFENSLEWWSEDNPATHAVWSADFGHTGAHSMKISSKPERTNHIKQPLHNVASTGTVGWHEQDNTFNITAQGAWMHVRLQQNIPVGAVGSARSNIADVTPDTDYQVAFDLQGVQGIQDIGVSVRFMNAAGDPISGDLPVNQHMPTTNGRRTSAVIHTPNGCQGMRVLLQGYRGPANVIPFFEVRNVVLCEASEPTAGFDGDDGTFFFWTGDVNDSSTVYHPPADCRVKSRVPIGSGTFTVSAYARAGSTIRSVEMNLIYGSDGGGDIATDSGTPTADVAGGWARFENTVTATSATTYVDVKIRIPSVARGEVHYIDSALFERAAGPADTFFSGATVDSPTLHHEWLGAPHDSKSQEMEFSVGTVNPPAETKTALTLISNDPDLNKFSFGFFYTFSNDVGESAVSQVTVVRTRRGWSQWRWQTPSATGEPSGTDTKDPTACADQLAAYMPSNVFADAIAAGAIEWSLYMFTWSEEDPVPTTALKLDSRPLNADSAYGPDSWLRATPSQAEASAETSLVPTLRTRFNSSDPSRAAQGLVAADRMVLVHDPTAQAVIKWSSNQQGFYSNFSPSKGGGYKTLTSGNLFIPACVKLWQNPQSADTLTILCQGTDGMSTGYYMAPAQISSQSEAISIMGFEETTATPGTTSPFGCEVLNNALYHPLDEMLMKSTATNYNINHSALTDQIRNMWGLLSNKHRIVSSQLDNRLYYLVENPQGLPVEEGCWGNEVWVLDAAQKAGSWSRWTVQGQSLRKVEQGGRVVMSLVHPTGIYYFDELASSDHWVDSNGLVQERAIAWSMETNTQGANRAHDAWCNLQQADIQVGFFQGELEYGVRGLDVNGQQIEVAKTFRDNDPAGVTAYDREDFLLVRKMMKEWFFFARSTTDELGEVQPSAGQLSLVQYRYTPISVNVGYEYGSIETFEYGRSDQPGATTVNGVPRPMIDTGRP